MRRSRDAAVAAAGCLETAPADTACPAGRPRLGVREVQRAPAVRDMKSRVAADDGKGQGGWQREFTLRRGDAPATVRGLNYGARGGTIKQ